jgi:hypothetical protein
MNDKSFAVRRKVQQKLNEESFGEFEVTDITVNIHEEGEIHATAKVAKRNSITDDAFLTSIGVRRIMSIPSVSGMKEGKVRFVFE